MTMPPYSRAAPAKVNLTLEVGAKRLDGYHDIDTILQELVLADIVTLHFDGGGQIDVTGPYADGTPADRTNLVWRAASELARLCGQSVGTLSIGLEKHIPAAGGLGGGASDAVATLRLLQPHWGASDVQLLAAATAIGSDEAYFLQGQTARARGRGEHVEALPPLEAHDVVLFIPPETLDRKTARLFSELDRVPVKPMEATERFAQAQTTRVANHDVVNHFECVARAVFPGLGQLWDAVESATGEAIHLAGAGPTLFWIGPPGQGGGIASASARLACATVLTRTAPIR